MGDKSEPKQIAVTGAKTIKIIKHYTDNDIIFDKIAHAKECGVLAVGIDVDHSYNHTGECDAILGNEMSGKSLDEIKNLFHILKFRSLSKVC